MKNSKHTSKSFLEDISFRYVPYWPLFIFLVLAFSACAWLYISYTRPLYETTATVLISDEKKGSDENKLAESLNVITAKKIVENEQLVIQSRDLIDEVVNLLHLYAPVYEKGKFRARSAYVTSPIIVKAVDPENIKEVDKVNFTYENNVVKMNGKNYPLNKIAITDYGNLIFIPNKNFKRQTENQLFFSLVEPKKVAAGVLKNLNVYAASKLSSIVRLSYKDEVPKRGEDILNTLVDKYNNSSIQYKNDIAKNTIDFVNERMRVVQQELNTVEKQIQNYKSQKGIVDLSEQGRLYLQNVGDNDQKLSEINMQLAVLNQVEKYVTEKEKTTGIVPSTLGVNDRVLSQLLDKLYESELNYQKLRKTTAENNPMVTAVADEIESIRPNILENIRNQRNSLNATKGNLNSTNRTYANILQTIPQKERELVDISRQQSIKNSIYSFLLQKREETAIAFASNVADSKVIETARASILPVSPNKPLVYLIAIALAFGFCIAYVSYKEMMSRKILFRSEIEDYTDIPIIAEISHLKPQRVGFKVQDDELIQDQFRQLRAAAGLFSNTNIKKKILITSSITGEGKSLISTNLAINLSLSGKKVVLVDLDLHHAETSKQFSVQDNVGVADYLEGDIEPYEIIKSTEYNNLHIVAAGDAKTNPTELISNGKLVHFFNYLEEAFDYVIIDSSPVNPVTDAYIISDYSDVTFYVVRHQYTPKRYIKKLDDNIKVKQLKNIAIIFNGIKQRGFMKGDYGYGYGYGYEYGYKKKKTTKALV